MTDTGKMRPSRVLLAVFAIVALAPALAGCFAQNAERDTGTVGSGGSRGVAVSPGYAPDVVSEEAAKSADMAAVPPSAGDGSGADASTVPADERLIITNKNLRIQVDDVNATVDAIRGLASKHKANITNMQVSTQSDVPVYNYAAQQRDSSYDSAPLQGWITVKVPADQYEAFIAEAVKLGRVLRQSEDTQDVTQEHVDLAARLGNLQAEEKRLREFFDAAKSVDDMLKIEHELARVRGEIESIDAQKKYLERQAAMATVTFELVEPTPVVSPGGEDWGVKDAFTQAVRWFVGTMNALIVLLGPALAIGIFVVLPAFLIIRAIIKAVARRQAKRAAVAAAEAEESGTPQ
ncbi:MAG: DUF4349 domain-containing protein [Actinobacteria bacterium]|nr:MAG: DUF4349 domain-containing protein [Actinomycetota bacterium]